MPFMRKCGKKLAQSNRAKLTRCNTSYALRMLGN